MSASPQASKEETDFFRLPKEKLIYILVNRIAVFFFLMCLLILFLYAAGTMQEFIDSTQLSLLVVYEAFGVFLTAASLCGITLNVYRFVKSGKTRYLLRAGGYLFLVVFACVTVLAVMAITALSGGNIQM